MQKKWTCVRHLHPQLFIASSMKIIRNRGGILFNSKYKAHNNNQNGGDEPERTAARYSRCLAKIMYWFVPVSTFQQEWNHVNENKIDLN